MPRNDSDLPSKQSFRKGKRNDKPSHLTSREILRKTRWLDHPLVACPRFSLFLKSYGWYRVDARGNKQGVEAEFNPPNEKLAFEIISSGERDFDGLFSCPIAEIVDVLTSFDNYKEVVDNLPNTKYIECEFTI